MGCPREYANMGWFANQYFTMTVEKQTKKRGRGWLAGKRRASEWMTAGQERAATWRKVNKLDTSQARVPVSKLHSCNWLAYVMRLTWLFKFKKNWTLKSPSQKPLTPTRRNMDINRRGNTCTSALHDSQVFQTKAQHNNRTRMYEEEMSQRGEEN